MTDYDDIVVGSGISGLTVSLLLALQGRRILLLEKAPRIGGALGRFCRQGVPFDVGFHFTGGFAADRHGVLDEMLTVLGIRDEFTPVFLPAFECHRIAFSSVGEVYEVPNGLDLFEATLVKGFPGEKTAIKSYFTRFRKVCAETATMTVSGLGASPEVLDEDHVTLRAVLDGLTGNTLLKALLSGFCVCYGTPPSEVSFANHCRMCYGLHEATARVEGGGDAFVDAFQRALANLGVELRCGTTISSCLEIQDRRVTRLLLSDGEEVGCDRCVLSIHPQNILDALPDGHVTKAFTQRVTDFEPSIGFFSLFGTLSAQDGATLDSRAVFSIFPDLDVDRMLSSAREGDAPMVMMRSPEVVDGEALEAVTALQTASYGDVARWEDSSVGRRPADYYEYKARQAERMRQRLAEHFPVIDPGLNIIETASMLTFRDYLNAPFGAAYGVKQKVGQFNVLGKLPILNFYAAGQSSVLPGVIGAMTSAFFVVRAMLGRTAFCRFMQDRL